MATLPPATATAVIAGASSSDAGLDAAVVDGCTIAGGDCATVATLPPGLDTAGVDSCTIAGGDCATVATLPPASAGSSAAGLDTAVVDSCTIAGGDCATVARSLPHFFLLWPVQWFFVW